MSTRASTLTAAARRPRSRRRQLKSCASNAWAGRWRCCSPMLATTPKRQRSPKPKSHSAASARQSTTTNPVSHLPRRNTHVVESLLCAAALTFTLRTCCSLLQELLQLMKPAAQWSSCIYSFTQTDLFFLVSFVVSFIAGAATADGIETVSPFVSSTLVAVCETLKIGGVTPRFSSAVEGCLNALIDSDPTCTHALAIGKVVCELASAGGASCEAALRVIPKWLVAAARDDSAFAAVRPILAQIARDFQRSRRLLALVSAVAEVRRCTRLSYLSESLGTSSSSCWISRTHARAHTHTPTHTHTHIHTHTHTRARARTHARTHEHTVLLYQALFMSLCVLMRASLIWFWC
jgi:hypothetical protein